MTRRRVPFCSDLGQGTTSVSVECFVCGVIGGGGVYDFIVL